MLKNSALLSTRLIKGKDGLVHISQLANERVSKVEDDVVKEGDRSSCESHRDRQTRSN